MHRPAHVFCVCLFLAVAVFAVFGQTLHYDFINYDDDEYVYQNPVVIAGLTPGGIARVFTHDYFSYSSPLTTLSHMVDCQIFGLRPGAHHLTNVLLHAAGAILLFLVLLRMTSAFWPCAFVAALFAIHPLRVESVAWITERKDVLSGLFFMLTLAAYLRYTRRPSFIRYAMVALLFAFGLMSKPTVVTIPFVLLLLDYWPLDRFGKAPAVRLFLEKIPLLALSAVSCAITYFQQHATGTTLLTEITPVTQLAANALVSYVAYIGQMFIPSRLAVLYPYPDDGVPAWQVATALILLVSISAAVLILRKKRPWLFVGWLWYLGMLVPMIGLIQAGVQARADRHTYLPQIGLYLMIAWEAAALSSRWRHGRLVAGTVMAAAVMALAACAWVQTSYWKNSETLWLHTIASTGSNAVAENNLANFLNAQERVDEAIPHLRKALEINPGYPDARNNLGVNLQYKGLAAEAIVQYKIALAMRPGNPTFMNNLSWLLATWPDPSIRDGPRAIELASEADRISGGSSPEILETLAAAYAETGRFRDASDTAGWAMVVAANEGKARLVDEIRAEMQFYQKRMPYREKTKF